jgi:hypothetical protein
MNVIVLSFGDSFMAYGRDRQPYSRGHQAARESVLECPRELLRKRLREGEYGECLCLTISYIWDRVKIVEEYLHYLLMTP